VESIERGLNIVFSSTKLDFTILKLDVGTDHGLSEMHKWGTQRAHPDDRLECKFPRFFLICLQKWKAALPDEKTAYLARLCMSIDLVSEAVFVKR
jgi:hypothetical protein